MKRKFCLMLVGAVLAGNLTGCGFFTTSSNKSLEDIMEEAENADSVDFATKEDTEEKADAEESVEASTENSVEEQENNVEAISFDDNALENVMVAIDKAKSYEEAAYTGNDQNSTQADMTETSADVRQMWENTMDAILMCAVDGADENTDMLAFQGDWEEKVENYINTKVAAMGGGSASGMDENELYADAYKNRCYALYRVIFRELETEEVIYENEEEYIKFSVYWPAQEVRQEYKTFIEERFTEEYIEEGMYQKAWFLDADNDGELELAVSSMYATPESIWDIEDGEVVLLAQYEGTALNLMVTYVGETAYVCHWDCSHGGRKYYNFEKYEGYNNMTDEFRLEAIFEDSDNYDENSTFNFRDEAITMEEYENLVFYYTYERG